MQRYLFQLLLSQIHYLHSYPYAILTSSQSNELRVNKNKLPRLPVIIMVRVFIIIICAVYQNTFVPSRRLPHLIPNSLRLTQNLITEAENSHDVEKLIALVTDDIVIEDVPFVPFGMVMKGKDGVRQGYAFFFEAAPDYKIEPKSWVTSDKSFASEWVLTATQKGDFR